MKHSLHKLMLLAVCLMASIYANAYDVEVDGIYYNLLSKTDKTVEVTKGDNKYTGDIVIPGKVTFRSEEFAVIGIGKRAFDSCRGLTSVTIPEGVTNIDWYAFKNCSGLTSVTIPESVTSIGSSAFKNCGYLSEVTLPNNLTKIESSLFSYCKALREITIPASVSTIQSYAFSGCSSLKKVICERSVPATLSSSAFIESTLRTATLIVPSGSKETYSIANKWQDFVNIVERISDISALTDEITKAEKLLATYPAEVAFAVEFANVINAAKKSVPRIPEELEYAVQALRDAEIKACEVDSSYAVLGTEIEKAESLLTTLKEGTAYTKDLSNAIDTAKNVDPATVAQVQGATKTLQDAEVKASEVDSAYAVLCTEIEKADSLLTTLKEGAAYTKDLSNAINTAKNVDPATVAQVQGATKTLQDAEENAITRSQYLDIAEGHYYIENVETGMFLEGGNSWGTQASLGHGIDFILAGAEGKYSLDSQISNGGNNHYLGSNGYVDGGRTTFVFKKAGDGYTISSGNAVLTASEGSTVVSFAAENGAYSQWRFVTKQERIKELRDRIMRGETDVDATFMIQDPNFGRNDQRISAWGEAGTVPALGGPNTNMMAEKWGGNSQTFTVKQTINGLPNGTYRLECKGFYRYNNTTSNTNRVAVDMHAAGTELIHSYLYANQVETPLCSIADDEAADVLSSVIGYSSNNCGLPFGLTEAENAFSRGLYDNAITFQVNNGTAVIGITKKQHDGCDWTVFDNFRLYYVSPQRYNIFTVAYKVSEALRNGSYNVNDIRSIVDNILER